MVTDTFKFTFYRLNLQFHSYSRALPILLFRFSFQSFSIRLSFQQFGLLLFLLRFMVSMIENGFINEPCIHPKAIKQRLQ